MGKRSATRQRNYWGNRYIFPAVLPSKTRIVSCERPKAIQEIAKRKAQGIIYTPVKFARKMISETHLETLKKCADIYNALASKNLQKEFLELMALSCDLDGEEAERNNWREEGANK